MAATQFSAPVVEQHTTYSRGTGEDQNRGPSLAQIHQQKLQTEREQTALAKLGALMPQMGPKAHALALTEVEWDVDAALNMLRAFQVANLERLNGLVKKRKKILEQIEQAAAEEEHEAGAEGAAQGDGAASSSSGGGSGSDSEAERQRAKKRKSSKDDKMRSGKDSKKRSSKDSKKRRSKDKDRERAGRDKKAKKRRRRDSRDRSASGSEGEEGGGGGQPGKLVHSSDYGKFGVLREADFGSKADEFILWAMETKGVNPELLTKWEEKDLQATYIEDFNTGTLPHKKYYNLAAYHASQRAKERKKAAAAGAGGAPDPGQTARELAANDEESLRRERQAERARQAQEQMEFAYKRIKEGGLVDEMRHQQLLRAEMSLAYKLGDKAKAKKIEKRLEPDDLRLKK